MTIKVDVRAKKKFIKELLTQHLMKDRGSVYIFNFLLNNDHVLKNVKFIDDAEGCSNVMIIPTQDVNNKFQFYTNGKVTDYPDYALNFLRNYKSEELSIVIAGRSSLYKMESYMQVIEENYNSSLHTEEESEYNKEATEFLNHTLKEFKINRLKSQIDETLDNGNKKEFSKLVKRLEELTK